MYVIYVYNDCLSVSVYIVPLNSETIFELLNPVASKWKEIAEELNLNENYIDELECILDTSEECLKKAVENWVQYHDPSWEELVGTLKSVQEEKLAQDISEKARL